MRQILFGFLIYVALFAASAMVGDAQTPKPCSESGGDIDCLLAKARKQREAQPRQTYFATGQQCLAALENGTANFYRPTYFNLHKAAASNEEVRGLEADACVNMLTVKGYRWVAQKEGEKMVFRGLTIHRRFDCGNPIKDILYPKTEIVDIPPVAPKCPEGTEPGETPGICIQVVEKEKIVTETVTVEKPIYINPCPTDAEFDGRTSWKSRLGGGLIQAGISGGASILISKARGADWNSSLRSGAYGVGMQRVEQALNASEDGVRLRIPSLGIDQKISRGEDVDFANGVAVRWNGSRVALFRNLNGESYRCDGFGLKKGSNLAVWTDGSSNGGKTPVKTQTDRDIPVRTGPATNNGGQIPGGGVPVIPGNGIPTRPRIGGNSYAPSAAAQPSGTVANPAARQQTTTLTCTGSAKPMLIGGKMRCAY